MSNKPLKRWFYAFMDKHNLNQRLMSEKLGLNYTYINSVVNGKKYLSSKFIHKLVCTWGMSAEDYTFLQQFTMSKKKLLEKKVQELEKENKALKKQQLKVSGIQQIKNYVIDNLYLKIYLQDYLNFIKFLDNLED